MIESLKKLGLTVYQSKLILTLLNLGASKASFIAKNCDVPKNKIYECLENLSKKGIVQVIPTIPKKYFIKSVNSILPLIKDKQEELEKISKKIHDFKKTSLNNVINEPVSIIYGHTAFVDKLKEETEKLEKECYVLAKKTKADPILLRLTESAIRRGVKVKMLFPSPSNEADEWKKAGAKVKFIDSQELAFSIFDDKICRLNINLGDNLNDPTIWIENKQFVNILREKFERLWKLSK